MSYYKDKNVLVTGGASGIGYELCSQLVRKGAKVLFTDINTENASRAAKELGCDWQALDVTDEAGFKACVAKFETDAGRLDILFNNAGLANGGEANTYEYSDWKNIIDVNVYGVVNGVHAVYADMVERRSGQIVNTASVAGLFPSAGQVAYSTSKYAVVGLSHSLRAEAAQYGVKINVVCPGIIKTSMRDNLTIKGMNAEKVLDILPDGMDVKKCVSQLLRGVEKNESTIVITPMAKALWGMNRLSPDLSVWFGGKIVGWLKGR